MKPELIAELEKINNKYPFRPFELETIDGRRIKVTQSFRRLYGQEAGDLMTDDGSVQILKYAELKDLIDFIPAWRRPFSWLYDRPHWVVLGVFLSVIIAIFIGVVLGLGSATADHGNQPTGRVPKPLVTTTETIAGNTVTTIRSGDFFTRIIKTAEGQSFVEEGYVNVWGEYHVTDVVGGTHK